MIGKIIRNAIAGKSFRATRLPSKNTYSDFNVPARLLSATIPGVMYQYNVPLPAVFPFDFRTRFQRRGRIVVLRLRSARPAEGPLIVSCG